MTTNRLSGPETIHEHHLGVFPQVYVPSHWPIRYIGRLIGRTNFTLLLFLLSSTSLFANDRTLRVDQLVHTSWTAQAGAPGAIHALAQSTDGYLWLGADAGLFHFDGVRFVHYQGPQSDPLPARAVASLLATPDGRLWVGFAYGGISVLGGGRVTTYSESDGLPPNSVMALAIDQGGVIWAATGRGGLAFLRGNKWIMVGKERGFFGEAWGLRVDSDGTLWVSGGRRLSNLVKGTREFTAKEDSSWYVTGADRSRDGTLWISDADDTGGVGPLGFEHDVKRRVIAIVHVVSTAFMFDRQGCLWVTTLGSGLRRIETPDQTNAPAMTISDSQLETFTEKDGLTSDYVQAILEDNEGNIWAGTSLGLDEFRAGAVIPVSFPPGSSYFSMSAGNDGIVWASPSNRHLYRIEDGKIAGELKKVNGITASFRDHDGAVWMAGGPSLNRLVGDRLVDVRIDNLESAGQHQAISAINEDADGRLWISIRTKGIFRLDGSKLTSLQSVGGSSGSALAIYGDPAGAVWFGIGKSVVELNRGKVQEFSSRSNLKIGAILAIHGNGSNVWVGGESGLAFFDGSGFREITGSDGLDFRAVSGIIATRETGVWISEGRGIIHFSSIGG